MKKGSLRDFEKYMKVKDQLPTKVKELLENAYHYSNSIHFEMVLNFIYNLYTGGPLSRWDAMSMDKYYSLYLTENIIGKGKFDRIDSLIDLAKDSI